MKSNAHIELAETMASSVDNGSDFDEQNYEKSDQRLRQLQPLNRTAEELAMFHAGGAGDDQHELRGRSIPPDDQQTAPLIAVDTAAEAVPRTASSSSYQRTLHHSSSAPTVTATSPMMSDLLLALQQSQSEEKERPQVNTFATSTFSSTTNNNLRAWMNPPIADYVDDQNEDDDDISGYHSPLEEAGSDDRTPRESPFEQEARTNQGIRASLDAGMATMGRWVRSRKAVPPPPPDVQEETNKSGLLASACSVAPRSANLFSNSNQIEFQNDTQINYDESYYQETDDAQQHRQRSVSEPEMRDFAHYQSSSMLRQRRRNSRQQQLQRARANTGERIESTGVEPNAAPSELLMNTSTTTGNLLATEAAVFVSQNIDYEYSSSTLDAANESGRTTTMGLDVGNNGFNLLSSNQRSNYGAQLTRPESPAVQGQQSTIDESSTVHDRERAARIRWIRINRRFQTVMTWVALLFSFLLFAILICWVVLTSTYVMSVQKPCDEPLKAYYWLVTLQLILDVFRTDIMRFVFNWDARSNQRIPPRVIIYNVAYLIYALMVLRLGVRSVYAYDEVPTCRSTAPDLFKACVAFVSLSIAAWTTIICGYLVPFFVVAVLLTWNGYSPSGAMHGNQDGASAQAVFPAAYSNSGAPPGCIDLLPIVTSSALSTSGSYPLECSICMEDFNRVHDTAVETKCRHLFHKRCLAEWLRQARSCPVCRDDIPATLEASVSANGTVEASASHDSVSDGPATIPIGPSGRPVVGLLRVLRRATHSFPENAFTSTDQRPSRATNDTTAIAAMEMEAGYATNASRL